MVFENGVKNIQAAAYNGARTVDMGRKNLPVAGLLTALGRKAFLPVG
jgi:hypothetical protein